MRARRLLPLLLALAIPALAWDCPAEAAEARYVVFVFDAGGRSWVHSRDANMASTGRQELTASTVAWAQKTIAFDSWRKVQLTGSSAITVREVVGFATREEASAYHWRLEQQGGQPWQNSHRPAAQPTPTPTPTPTPRPEPQPWNPPQPVPALQSLRGTLSFTPQSPATRESIQFQLNVTDPNDPGWPDWQTTWYAGGQAVGGLGTSATQVSFGIVNPGTYTVSVQVRNARTGATGNFWTTVQVRAAGVGPGTGTEPPPIFQPEDPNREPFPPDRPDGTGPYGRRPSKGRVPGLGDFGRLPGPANVFQALVAVLGPGAMALILHIMTTLFGGGGGGGGERSGGPDAPLAGKVPDGPVEPEDKKPADDGSTPKSDPDPPPEEAKTPPEDPAKPPAPPEAAKGPAPGRTPLTDLERERMIAVLQGLQGVWKQEGRDVSLLKEFLGSTAEDVATLPGWVLKGLGKAAKVLGNPENWLIAGETIAGTADDILVHPLEGGRKAGRAALDVASVLAALGQRAGSALWNDPIDAIKQGGRGALSLARILLGIDNWSKVVDGDVPLGERLARALYGAFEGGLVLWGAAKLPQMLSRAAGQAEWRGVLRAPGLAEAADDAVDAARVANAADDAGDAARVAGHADGLTDVERTAGRLEQAGNTARRRAAWDGAMRQATGRVDEFENALLSGDRDRVRKAMIEIQNDKLALQEINARGNNLKRLYKDGWQEVYDKTDDLVRQEIAQRYGVDPSQVRLVTPTNPPPPGAAVKVGADRDVTYRIFKEVDGKPACFDVEHGFGQEAYDRAFHQAAEGAKHCPGVNPRQFTGGCDQLVTSAQHADAYGNAPKELAKILSQPEAPLSDPTQIGQVMGYKSQEVYQQVDHMRDRITALRLAPGGGAEGAAEIARLDAQAERLMFEGMRQNTKQWNNQILRRVAALRAQGQGVEIPERLEQAVGVLNKVKPGGASPAEATAELARMGTTPDRVAYETGKFLESMEKLKPQPPGIWGKICSGLGGVLAAR